MILHQSDPTMVVMRAPRRPVLMNFWKSPVPKEVRPASMSALEPVS